MKILIIEDEYKVASFIKEGLENHGFRVEIALDGNSGLSLALNLEYELVILDILLPNLNGLQVCTEIRKQKPEIPILMLTALGTPSDKVKGLDCGADDYLVKPFDFNELTARIKSLTRRYQNKVTQKINKLSIADLELDLDKKSAFRGGNTIELTAKEFSLLEFFIRNKNKVLSRIEIAENVWDINFETGTNVVDVYVNFLRKKIDRDYPKKLLHTHIGMGYILKET
jgi:two-component system, OmpR family, copper resistance phosphate regulon response regulator CusR